MRKKDLTSNKLFVAVTVGANFVALSLGDEIKVSPEQIFSNEIVQLVETIKYF